MEDGIVAAIDGVSTIDVRHYRVTDFLRARRRIAVHLLKVRQLMRARMRSEDRLIVHVVGIRSAASRVVRGEVKNIEIQRRGHDRILLRVVSILRPAKLAFDQFPCDCNGVVLVKIEPAADVRKDRFWSVGPLVCSVGLSLDDDWFS